MHPSVGDPQAARGDDVNPEQVRDGLQLTALRESIDGAVISSLKGKDRIVVLAEGRITAEGTYDELLETSATFRTLAGVEG